MRKQIVSLLAGLLVVSSLPAEARLPKRMALRTVKWGICVPVYLAGTGTALVAGGACLVVTAAGAGVAIIGGTLGLKAHRAVIADLKASKQAKAAE